MVQVGGTFIHMRVDQTPHERTKLVGDQRSDKQRQTWTTDNVGRETTTEELRRLQRIEYHYRDYKGNRDKSKRSCTIQQIASILQHTTESVKRVR